MMLNDLNRLLEYMRGATMMAEIGVAIFFLKYWKETGDRLFLFFSLAFGVMALSQLIVSLSSDDGELAPIGYCVRTTAFALLILGIFEKNRPLKNKGDSSDHQSG